MISETARARNGELRLFAVLVKRCGIIPFSGRGEHSMTYPMAVNRAGDADQIERLPPGVAMGVITALSFVCWMSLISTEIAIWSAFN
jgi:hypothetical protein